MTWFRAFAARLGSRASCCLVAVQVAPGASDGIVKKAFHYVATALVKETIVHHAVGSVRGVEGQQCMSGGLGFGAAGDGFDPRCADECVSRDVVDCLDNTKGGRGQRVDETGPKVRMKAVSCDPFAKATPITTPKNAIASHSTGVRNQSCRNAKVRLQR